MKTAPGSTMQKDCATSIGSVNAVASFPIQTFVGGGMGMSPFVTNWVGNCAKHVASGSKLTSSQAIMEPPTNFKSGAGRALTLHSTGCLLQTSMRSSSSRSTVVRSVRATSPAHTMSITTIPVAIGQGLAASVSVAYCVADVITVWVISSTPLTGYGEPSPTSLAEAGAA